MRKGICWLAGLLSLLGAIATPTKAPAQNPYYPGHQLNNFYYYPYQYYPWNYWPAMAPRYPEQPGQPYMKPPAYMAYPAFHQENWRYELWQPQRYHRGFHFWLDQF
jgi:hypothetical protein